MVNLIRVVSGMMDSFERYREAMDNDIAKRDYYRVCLECRHLLESLGEDKVTNWELEVNSEQLKRGIHALKTMSEQLDDDVIDEDLVRSSYRKFKENSSVFMKELFEFLPAVPLEKPEEFVGKDVEWKYPAGKIIKGKISSSHGNKGVIRAIFEKGLPGQAVTTEVKIK